jgi:hypothetical protein
MAVIDSLKILIGMDASELEAGIQSVNNLVQNGAQAIADSIIPPLTQIENTAPAIAGAADGATESVKKTTAAVDQGAKTHQQYSRATEIATQKAQGFRGALSAVGTASVSVQSSLKSLISTIIGPLSAALAVGSAFSNYVQKADSLGLLAQRLGMDVQTIDAWSSAVQNAGGSAEAFQSTLKSFQDNLRNAAVAGGGGNVEWLYYLGIRATDAHGKLRNLTDILPELADRVQGMSTMRSTYLLQKLGLDEGTIRLVQRGRHEIDALVGEMRDYAYTQRDADTARKFNAAIQGLGKASESVAAIIMRAALPAITAIADKAREFIRFLRQNEEFVITFFTILTAYSMRFLLAWAANPVVLAIAAIIAAVTALALVIEDLWAYIEGGDSQLAEFWALFGTGEEIAASLGKAWERLKAVGEELFNWLRGELQNFLSYFEPILEPLKSLFFNLFELIGALLEGNFRKAGENLRGIFEGLGQVIIRALDGAVRWLWDSLKRLWDWILNLDAGIIWDKLKEFAGGLFGLDEKSKEEAKEEINRPDNELNKASGGVNDYLSGAAMGMPVAQPAPTSAPTINVMPAIQPMQYGAGLQATAAAMSRPSQAGETKVNAPVNIGSVTVETQATDAQGVAEGLGDAMGDVWKNIPQSAWSGVNQK